MIIGRIKSEQTFQQTESGRIFTGMDISAEYLNDKGKPALLTFHYLYSTNDVMGKVQQVLSYLASGKPMPDVYSNVETKNS